MNYREWFDSLLERTSNDFFQTGVAKEIGKDILESITMNFTTRFEYVLIFKNPLSTYRKVLKFPDPYDL